MPSNTFSILIGSGVYISAILQQDMGTSDGVELGADVQSRNAPTGCEGAQRAQRLFSVSFDLARSPRSPASSSSRITWSSGSLIVAPASSRTCKHSANRGERRYISIRQSIGRLPLIGSVALTPAASKSRMPSGECSSNAPSRSASVDTFDLNSRHNRARTTATLPGRLG